MSHLQDQQNIFSLARVFFCSIVRHFYVQRKCDKPLLAQPINFYFTHFTQICSVIIEAEPFNLNKTYKRNHVPFVLELNQLLFHYSKREHILKFNYMFYNWDSVFSFFQNCSCAFGVN